MKSESPEKAERNPKTKSRLIEKIGTIQNTLTSIQRKDSDPPKPERLKIRTAVDTLKAELESKNKQLASVTEKELSTIEQDIKELKMRADALSARSFLIDEIALIEKILHSPRVGLFRRSQLEQLRSEINERKQKLESWPDSELTSFRANLDRIRESANTLVIQPSFATRLRSISMLVWIGIIPAVLLLYMGIVAMWQRNHQNEIQTIAAMTSTAMPTATATFPRSPAITLTPVTPVP
jgi:DNA repair exonuclease SbcCD ATPase subunit